MAERLPRYRPLGVRIPGVPSVNYAQTGAVQAQVYESISRSLDQMASFAYKRDEARTIRQAERYAFDNPLTKEQINVALEKGGISESDINLDRDTVFGATVLATTSKLLSADLNGEYRTAVASLEEMIQGPDWNPDDPNTGLAAISAQLRGMEDGYTSLIADIDPKEALSFKASVSALGGAVYKTALEQTNKKKVLFNRMKMGETVGAFDANVRQIIRAHAGETELLDSSIDVLRNNYMSELFKTGDIEFAESEAAKIAGRISNAKIDVLSELGVSSEFASSPTQALNKIRSGDFGRYSDIFAKMSGVDKAKVRKNIRTEISARKKVNDDARAASKRNAESRAAHIVYRLHAFDSMLPPDIAGGPTTPYIRMSDRKKLVAELYEIHRNNPDAISLAEIQRVEESALTGGPRNQVGEYTVLVGIANGTITDENFNRHIAINNVSAVGAKILLDSLRSKNKEDLRKVEKMAREAVGVLSEQVILNDREKTEHFKFMAAVNARHAALLQQYEDSGGKDRPPSLLEAATQIRQEKFNSVYFKQVQENLGELNNDYKKYTIFEFKLTTTEEQINDLDLKGVKKGSASEKSLKNEMRVRLRKAQEANAQYEASM